MTTRLEQLVDFMACRVDEASEGIRGELADPASDASRWLAAARALTRGISDERSLAAFDLRPAPPAAAAGGKLRFASGGLAAAAAAIATIVGAAWWAERGHRHRLEAVIAARDEGLARKSRPLEESPRTVPSGGEDRLAIALERLGQMSDRVGRIDRRLEALKPQSADPTAPALAELRLAMAREEAAIRRLETRLDGLGPVRGDVRDKPAIDGARIELILTRLRELSQRIDNIEGILTTPPVEPPQPPRYIRGGP